MAYVVRYGRMRFLGECTGLADQDHVRGQRVVIRSDRGTELGEILCPATERTASFLEQSVAGEILRPATHEDLEHEAALSQARKNAFDVCQELISNRRLQMDLVDVEIILGRERIVFYYLAEKRVDFRDLVKDLARALRTRIEMRQIGVRDEAKLLADYGDCGKPVCCNTHLTAMPPVSMKMAKLQKTTLDPAKISGRCGRLKCCLRYEFDTYRTLERQLPAVGSQVVTSKGRGRVVGQEILAQKLVVEYEDHRRIIISPDDVLSVEPSKNRQAPGSERTGPKRVGSPEDELELESVLGVDADHAAWSDHGPLDEAEPETPGEDGNDPGPDRRDRRGG
jgi:cell fate regulator YaaT (PSP1 superfamily)